MRGQQCPLGRPRDAGAPLDRPPPGPKKISRTPCPGELQPCRNLTLHSPRPSAAGRPHAFTVVRLVCFRPGMPPPGKTPGGRRRIGAPESRTQIAPIRPARTFWNHRPELSETRRCAAIPAITDTRPGSSRWSKSSSEAAPSHRQASPRLLHARARRAVWASEAARDYLLVLACHVGPQNTLLCSRGGTTRQFSISRTRSRRAAPSVTEADRGSGQACIRVPQAHQ